MSTLLRYKSAFHGEQHRAIVELDSILENLITLTGNSPLQFKDSIAINPQSNPQTSSAKAPPAASFSVVPVDGKFIITVANPQNVLPQSAGLVPFRALTSLNAQAQAIVHNIQSASTVDFDNSSKLTDYGISGQLAYEFQNPNVTLFWRLRSSYDGITWNAWQIYSSALTCGPVGVYSGMLTSPALVYLNSTAMTADGSIAISQHGATTQIDIAGKVWNVGPQRIAYSAGSVDPGIFGTFYIYAVDNKKAGGVVTYLATQNLGDLSSQDGIIQFGSITTVMGGGGVPGFGGFCPIREVKIRMFDGTQKDASTIKKGDALLAPDGGKEIAQADAELIAAQPCFSFRLDNGIEFSGASSGELVLGFGGGWIRLIDLTVGDSIQTRRGTASVTKLTFLGERAVYRIRLPRTRRYIGDDVILHNMKMAP